MHTVKKKRKVYALGCNLSTFTDVANSRKELEIKKSHSAQLENKRVTFFLLGLLLTRLGILGKNELSASKSEGFVFFLLMAVVLAGFSTTTPQMFTQMLPPLLLILFTDLVAITLLSALVGRMLGFSAYMGIALGMNIMIGFPLNMLISQEVIYRLVVDEHKRSLLMSEIGDRMVICGMISVTFLSTTAAGFLVYLMK